MYSSRKFLLYRNVHCIKAALPLRAHVIFISMINHRFKEAALILHPVIIFYQSYTAGAFEIH